eukprot:sb/3476623/
MEKHGVYVSIKPKPKQCCWTVVLKTRECNTPNLYSARTDLIAEMELASPNNLSPWQSLSSSRNSPTSPQGDTDELTKSLAQLEVELDMIYLTTKFQVSISSGGGAMTVGNFTKPK